MVSIGYVARTHKKGFTLVEVVVTLAIVAILAAAGTQMRHWVSKIRVLAETTELLESFALGRQYAISSNSHVTICGSTKGDECDGGWHAGFLVFVSDDNDDEFINQQLTPVLYRHQTSDASTARSNIRKFTFRPSGLLKGKSGSLLYCPGNGDMKNYRRIVVSRGGRIRSYTPEQVARKRYLSTMRCS